MDIELTPEQLEQQKIEEDANLAESKRVLSIREKFKNLYEKDAGLPSFRKVWPDISNPQVFIEDNINDKNFDFKFDQISAKDLEIDSFKSQDALDKAERDAGLVDIKKMIQNVKNSTKEAWEKKLLIRLIKDMK